MVLWPLVELAWRPDWLWESESKFSRQGLFQAETLPTPLLIPRSHVMLLPHLPFSM